MPMLTCTWAVAGMAIVPARISAATRMLRMVVFLGFEPPEYGESCVGLPFPGVVRGAGGRYVSGCDRGSRGELPERDHGHAGMTRSGGKHGVQSRRPGLRGQGRGELEPGRSRRGAAARRAGTLVGALVVRPADGDGWNAA